MAGVAARTTPSAAALVSSLLLLQANAAARARRSTSLSAVTPYDNTATVHGNVRRRAALNARR